MKKKIAQSGFAVALLMMALLFASADLSSVHAQVDSSGVPITFVFTHKLAAGETGVGLNGNFNNWGVYYNRHPYQMQNVGNNLW
ncbi:MAG: hypothetical protein M1470_02335, partial [Bacteroidetes bacterium]|nr:hypothetical protein [Bacteroidota bacterium]